MGDKSKKKFVGFHEMPFEQFKSKGSGASHEVIIKRDKVSQSGKIRTLHLHDDEEQPEVIVHEKDGMVDVIEFKCTCGKSVKVKLNYADDMK